MHIEEMKSHLTIAGYPKDIWVGSDGSEIHKAKGKLYSDSGKIQEIIQNKYKKKSEKQLHGQA